MKHDKSSNGEVKRTVVEEGTRFKGDLVSTCPIDVRGLVEGEIEAPSLTVSAKGAVHGRAKVGAVRSEGELSGEFEAEIVELSGVVRDKTVIRARSLEVKLSSAKGQQVIFGDCELSIGDEPTEYDAVDDVAMQAGQAEAEHSESPPAVASGSEPAPSAELAGAADSEVPPSEQVAAEREHEPVHSSIAEALASGAGASESKVNGGEQSSGWSQPPSQPPPAE
jgi:cytoskeletal protein CcmA (bactofilin family)